MLKIICLLFHISSLSQVSSFLGWRKRELLEFLTENDYLLNGSETCRKLEKELTILDFVAKL